MVSEESVVEAGRLAGVSHLLLLAYTIDCTEDGIVEYIWKKLIDIESGQVLGIEKTPEWSRRR